MDKKAVKKDFYYHLHNFDQLQFSWNFFSFTKKLTVRPNLKNKLFYFEVCSGTFVSHCTYLSFLIQILLYIYMMFFYSFCMLNQFPEDYKNEFFTQFSKYDGEKNVTDGKHNYQQILTSSSFSLSSRFSSSEIMHSSFAYHRFTSAFTTESH